MKDQTIFLILGILLVGALFYINQEPEPLGIEVEYYQNGQKVSNIFSAFIKYDQIRFNVYASNTGGYRISDIKLVNASPPQLENALPVTSFETLEVGERNKLIFTSNLINVDEFTSMPQPVTFWIKISGKDELNNIISQETSTKLTFVEEIGNIFRGLIGINSGFNVRDEKNATDDDGSTYMFLQYKGSYTYDLGSVTTKDIVIKLKYFAVYINSFYNAKIQYSEDGNTWTDLESWECTGPYCAEDTGIYNGVYIGIKLRYFRFLIDYKSSDQQGETGFLVYTLKELG